MLLASVPPREACSPPAPNGRSDSLFEKKKRAATLSFPPLNSLSQAVVNWSSVNLPGLLIMNGAVFTTASQVVVSGIETPGVPGKDGNKNPLASPPNWLLLRFNRARLTSSMLIGTPAQGPVVGVLKIAARLAAERSVGRIGRLVLINVPGESPLR